MRPLDLVILVLATYYAAVTLAKLHGPLGLAERMRHAVYRRRGFVAFPRDGEAEWLRPRQRELFPPGVEQALLDRALQAAAMRQAVPADTMQDERIADDWLAAGISCPLCLSLYCGAVLALAWYAGGEPEQAVVVVLAVAGGASAVFSVGRYW